MRVKLTEICTPKQWKTIPTSELLENGFPVYGANGIIGYYSEYNHENSVVAITCRGATCGAINITVPKAYITGNAMCLDNVRQDVIQEYLYYCLIHYDFNNVISGSAQPQITRQGLEKVSIELYSIDKQKEIVEKLDKVQKILEFRKQELQKLDDLVKARFVEMFGCPTDNVAKYPKVKINDLIKEGKASIKAGPFGSSLKKEFYVEKGYKIYGQEQVIKDDPTFGDYYIDEKRFNSLKSCEVHAGDILISLVGTCGKTMIMPEIYEPGIINPRLLKIAFDAETIVPVYFKFFFASDDLQAALNSVSGHSTMNVVNAGMLKEIELIVPPMGLQNQFADFVKQVDKSKFVVQQALDKAQLLFDSLMQKYFG